MRGAIRDAIQSVQKVSGTWVEGGPDVWPPPGRTPPAVEPEPADEAPPAPKVIPAAIYPRSQVPQVLTGPVDTARPAADLVARRPLPVAQPEVRPDDSAEARPRLRRGLRTATFALVVPAALLCGFTLGALVESLSARHLTALTALVTPLWQAEEPPQEERIVAALESGTDDAERTPAPAPAAGPLAPPPPAPDRGATPEEALARLVQPLAPDEVGSSSEGAPNAGVAEIGPPPDARVIVRFTQGREEAGEVARRVAGRLQESGFVQVDVRAVDFPIQSQSIRFFFEDDRPVAETLRGSIDALFDGGEPAPGLRDFTFYEPKPAPRTIEVWIGG